jgi:predicted dehydrogenase/nucleoside-diphosphate-sugar epimerase
MNHPNQLDAADQPGTGNEGRRSPRPPRRLRIAVVGCGAIAQQFHLPVLAGHDQVELTALVDRDADRARQLAQTYGVPHTLAEASELTPELTDGAIVATPPFHHAPCAIDLLRRGMHVLVEKPMATCYQDALAMAEAADAAGRVLSVGVFRRLYPSVRALAAAVRGEILGRPLRFDFEGGGIYSWPAATLGNMKKEWAGGGVLMDMGPHYLDLLLAVFDGSGRVVRYRDNSLGGIETDCVAELELVHGGGPVPGRVECSRTRQLRGTLRIECERGMLELPFSERFRVQMKTHAGQFVDPATGQTRELDHWLDWSGEPETDWFESFRAAIDDWLGAVRGGAPPRLSGRSVLESMRLIDECYARREPLAEPWIEHPLRDRRKGTSNRPRRRVLVTGGTGFIGCRVAELLADRDGYEVRALVHNPGNASRLARLPVEMLQGDLRDAEAVAQAVAGCDAIVHCAIGTEYGDRRRIFEVTVDGTQKLVQAAAAAGVRRLVHLSTIAVYGNDVAGIIDESTPVRPGKGDDYGESKYRAEMAVRKAGRQGLPVVILRPARVYGPYGATFITRPMTYLKRGKLVLEDAADSPSNTVYVDNVVEAAIRAIEADTVCGAAYTIADDDGTTMGQFYGYFADAIGSRVVHAPASPNGSRSKASRQAWLTGIREVLTSKEFKAFGKKVLYSDPLGRLPRLLLKHAPGLERWLQHRMGGNQPLKYVRPESDESEDCLRFRRSRVTVSSDRARRELGYAPLIPRDEALARTLAWLRYSRLV